MPDTREKLVELLCDAHSKAAEAGTFEDATYSRQLEMEADHLIANGVTFATDTNVGGKWIPVDDRLPENDVMVIGYTPCDGFMFVGYYHEEPEYDWKVWRIITAMRSTKVMKKKVTHWLPLPQPPKGE